MPLTGPLWKLAFGGRLFSDEWAMTMHLSSVDQTTNLEPQPFALPISQWFGRPQSALNAAAILDYIKVNQINPVTGRYVDLTTTKEYVVTPAVASGGNNRTAPQLSVAISLRTAAERGRGHAGRVYPPSGAGQVDETGRQSSAQAAEQAASFATMVQLINGLFVGFRVGVYSRVAVSFTPLTHVVVGRVIDTQRRRRSKLDEGYSPVASVVP